MLIVACPQFSPAYVRDYMTVLQGQSRPLPPNTLRIILSPL